MGTKLRGSRVGWKLRGRGVGWKLRGREEGGKENGMDLLFLRNHLESFVTNDVNSV